MTAQPELTHRWTMIAQPECSVSGLISKRRRRMFSGDGTVQSFLA
jgi:hypothetical protein